MTDDQRRSTTEDEGEDVTTPAETTTESDQPEAADAGSEEGDASAGGEG